MHKELALRICRFKGLRVTGAWLITGRFTRHRHTLQGVRKTQLGQKGEGSSTSTKNVRCENQEPVVSTGVDGYRKLMHRGMCVCVCECIVTQSPHQLRNIPIFQVRKNGNSEIQFAGKGQS